MMNKLIAATDFSDEAELAVQQAALIAEQSGVELVVVHVEPPSRWIPNGAQLKSHTAERAHAIVDEVRRTTLARLEQTVSELRGRVQTVHYAATSGHPDEAICTIAKDLPADLVVTGTHGRTGVPRLLLGSVAERVVRQSPAPVMVVRAEVTKPSFQRILVPTDFSDGSERALAWALKLAGPGAVIELFHVWHPSFGGHDYFTSQSESVGQFRDELEKSAIKTADEWMERHRRDGITLRFDMVGGGAADRIHTRLIEHKYDLVAMGSHGHRGFRRLIVGSVAERTVRHAPCSVLVAHGGAPAP